MARALYQADDHGEAGRPEDQRAGNPVDAPREREPGYGKGGGYGLKPHQHKHCHSKYHDEQDDIDKIKCQAVGDKARSDYISVKAEGEEKSLAEAMQDRQTILDELPARYAKQRQQTLDLAKTTRTTIASLYKALCDYPDKDTRTLFDEAWQRVLGRVKSCTGTPSWCPPKSDCEFSFNPNDDTQKLTMVRHRFERQVVKAEQQFDEMADEPADLKKRGEDVVKEVNAIKVKIDGPATPATPAAPAAAAGAAAAAEQPPRDDEAIYAALLVAEYHAQDETLLNGIPNAAALEHYLGVNLTCSVHGRRALKTVVGILAERECTKLRKQTRCNALQADLSKELLAEVADLRDEYESVQQA